MLQALTPHDIGEPARELLQELFKREEQIDRTRKFTWKTRLDITFMDYSVFAVFESGRDPTDRTKLEAYLRESWDNFTTEKAIERTDLDLDMNEMYMEFVKMYPFRILNSFEYLPRGSTPERRGRNRRAVFQESDTVSYYN